VSTRAAKVCAGASSSGPSGHHILKWKEISMSIVKIILSVRALSRGEKFRLAHMLLDDLAREELPALFKEAETASRKPCQRMSW
jgi:hypothetical protein